MKTIALTLLLILVALFTFAEDTYRSEMEKANDALAKKDYKLYLTHMQKALQLEPDKVSRPYYQYALARAFAYNDDLPNALKTLEALYNEGIEAPMIFITVEDPAYKKYLSNKSFQKLQEQNSTHQITISPIVGNIFLIEGAGCFLTASIGDDGILLVDTGYPQISSRIIDALNKQSGGKKIKRIINTHEHMDHVGGNAAMRKEATVIAHANVRTAIEKPSEYFSDFSVAGMPENQWPDMLFKDEISLYFNGEEIRVIGLNAHSEGDSIVYFAKSNVLHMGDNYFPDTKYIYPGKKIKAYFDVLDPFVKSLPNNVMIASGHAKPVALSEFRAKYDKTFALYEFVQNQLQRGQNFETSKAVAEEKGYPIDWVQFYFKNLSNNQTEENKK